jgi:gas vesicle protein
MFCSHDERTRSILVALVVGGLVGAGLALLLAPQSGKRTRQQIADLAEDLRDYAADLGGKVRAKVGGSRPRNRRRTPR